VGGPLSVNIIYIQERPTALQAHSLSILSEHGESESSNSVSDYHETIFKEEVQYTYTHCVVYSYYI
jgi:hypothetical protein